MTEREFAIDVVQRLRNAGYQALWAGGCVRDELLGLTPKDYDIATDARPEEVRRLFRRTVAVGMSFGVVEVLGPRTADGPLKVQVATFRSDVSYSDGRHPDAVVFASAREDALRRDFTINGMFFDPLENKIHDYVNGQQDLGERILRAIGDPAKRFDEDKLRMLRAVRFATCFDLTVDPATAEAVKAMAQEITVVSAERIAEELRRLLVHPCRGAGLELLHDLGLVAVLLAELLPMKELPHGPPDLSTDNVWNHIVRVLHLLGSDVSFPLAFAALLHRVGGPATSAICLRLKLSNEERERIEWLVGNHACLVGVRQMRISRVKTILAHPGIRELLTLHRAIALAGGDSTDHVEYCEKLLGEWKETDLNPPPLVTGHDLLARGLEAGPLFKRLLDAVREGQLEGTIKTPEEAMRIIDEEVNQTLS